MAVLRVPCVASARLRGTSARYNVSLRPLAASSLCWLVFLLHLINGSFSIGLDGTLDMKFKVTRVHCPKALYGERVPNVHDDLMLCLHRGCFESLCIVMYLLVGRF